MAAEINKGPFLGQRHLQTLLLFLAIVVNYIAKYSIGIVLVAMTNANTTNPNFDEYNWSEKQKSYILSSFYWGYFITQFPGGYLCRHYGVKLTMFGATFGSAVFAILPPFCVPWGGWKIYCGIRIIQGLFQGFFYPCVYAHLAAWCPVNERNRLGALASTGVELGTLLAMFLSGIIATSSWGWPGVSYVTSALSFAWCIAWIALAANTPRKSRCITEGEANYIESSKKQVKLVDSKEELKKLEISRKIPVPWHAIFTSIPFWALLFARTTQSWGFSTLQAEIPSYMNGVLNMNMKNNALYSALPYLTMFVMSYVYLISADIFLSQQILTLNALRKIFNSIAYWIPAAGLIAVGFVGEQQRTLAIVLMTVNVGISAGNTIGSSLNTIDLSPNHAGILMGMINTVANIIPIITPLLVGVIVEDEHNRTEWQIVFIIAAIVLILGNLFFVTFGSTELQPWDDESFLLMKEVYGKYRESSNAYTYITN